jgi:hypothetical protein
MEGREDAMLDVGDTWTDASEGTSGAPGRRQRCASESFFAMDANSSCFSKDRVTYSQAEKRKPPPGGRGDADLDRVLRPEASGLVALTPKDAMKGSHPSSKGTIRRVDNQRGWANCLS